jgi:hypothetical protein
MAFALRIFLIGIFVSKLFVDDGNEKFQSEIYALLPSECQTLIQETASALNDRNDASSEYLNRFK